MVRANDVGQSVHPRRRGGEPPADQAERGDADSPAAGDDRLGRDPTSGSWVSSRVIDGPWWGGALIGATVAAGFVLLAQFTMLVDDPVRQGAAFFPAAGFSVGVMLLLPTRRWGWALAGVAMAEFFGNLAHGYGVASCALWATANTVEPLVGAALVRAFIDGRRYLVPARNTVVFILSAAVAAPVVGATVGSAGTSLMSSHEYSLVWLKWMVGDSLGVLVVAPLLLSWKERPSSRKLWEQLTLLVCIIATPLLVFNGWGVSWEATLPYLTIPMLAWVALRHGLRWTAWSILVITQVSMWATDHGYGPFADDVFGDAPFAFTALQAYLGIVAATGLLMAALAEDLVDRQHFEAVLQHTALHDGLTGLPKREYLELHLAELTPAAGTTALFVCDVDNFKMVNDALGHHAGDEYLIEIVARMRRCLPDDDLLVRLGGDEFVVVVHDTTVEAIEAIADSIVAQVAAPLPMGERTELCPSVSIGVALCNADVDSSAALREADAALYEAKVRGRGQVCWFDQQLRVRVMEQISMESDLAEAIGNGGVHAAFQPGIDLSTGEVVYVEALARWRHVDHGSIAPDRFIPVAELTCQIDDLFTSVLRRSLAARELWLRESGRSPVVAVNVSTMQLRGGSLQGLVAAELESAGVGADGLWLEVTESGLADAAVYQTLEALAAMGVRLAIDDFGTGWSSMSRLAAFPWDALKIDRSFVSDLGITPGVEQVVAATVGLAHSLGIRAIAEGVETGAQLHRLRELGCDVGQGFLLGRPDDAHAVAERLRHDAPDLSALTVLPGSG